MNSINAAGFSEDYKAWHISKHDVYGELFRNAWENKDDTEVNPNEIEILTQMDDLTIIEVDTQDDI